MKSLKKRERMVEDQLSNSNSEDGSMVMLIEDPKIELDEFATFKQMIKKRKIQPAKQEKIRKRIYSKEDVKIGLISDLNSRAISPEFQISDEEENQIDKERAEYENERTADEGKNPAHFGRSLTFPSS